MLPLLQETTFIQGIGSICTIAVYYGNCIYDKEAFVAGATVTLTMVNMTRLERCNLYPCANNVHMQSLQLGILNEHSIVCTFPKGLWAISVVTLLSIINMVTTTTMIPVVNTVDMFHIVTMVSTALWDIGSGISVATVLPISQVCASSKFL